MPSPSFPLATVSGADRGLPRRSGLALLALVLIAALAAVVPAPPAAAQLCATPGKDGAGGVLSGVVNGYRPGTASVSSGATSIPVGARSGAATAITAGDLLLVVQMQDGSIDTDNDSSYGDGVGGGPGSGATSWGAAGLYEFVVADGPVSAGSVPIRGDGPGGGLIHSYRFGNPSGTLGRGRYQVIRVPQHTTATLSSGLTALAWNGSVGGVLALDVRDALAFGGATVSVTGRGFRGGGGRSLGGGSGFNRDDYRRAATVPFHAAKAEGVIGTPRYLWTGSGATLDTGSDAVPAGGYARGAPGNAGGGGNDWQSSNDNNSGGGGGGNGGTGGGGGNTWSSNQPRGGFGGVAFPAAVDRLVQGGGGGAGTSNNAGPAHGAPGGGMVFVRTGTVSGSGSVVADGVTPPDSRQDGAGGGGAGGSVLFLAKEGLLTGLTVSARGGDGADVDWNNNDHHGPGGGGGGGVALLSATPTAVDVSGGTNGLSPASGPDIPFGATPGAAGVSTVPVDPADVPGAGSGSECFLTQALVASFTADGAGTVTWETASEVATAAFELWRLDGSGWSPVEIVTAAPPAPQGAVHRVETGYETGFEAGTRSWALVEIETGGARRVHGPFPAVGAWPERPDGPGSEAPEALAETLSPTLSTTHGTADDAPRRRPRRLAAAPTARELPGVAPSATELRPFRLGADALRVSAASSGVHRISAATLAAGFGIPEARVRLWILRSNLRLEVGGGGAGVGADEAVPEVPWWPSRRGDALLFWVPPLDSNLRTESTFTLVPGRGSGARGRPVRPAAPVPGAAVPTTRSLEVDRFAGLVLPLDPREDHWFWHALAPGGVLERVEVPFDAPALDPGADDGAAGGAGEVTVRLQGATAAPHRLRVILGGVELGTVSGAGVEAFTGTVPVPAGLLAETGNRLELVAEAPAGGGASTATTASTVYLDGIEVTYPRRPDAGGAAEVRFAGRGGSAAVGGLLDDDLLLLDVTDPATPRSLPRATVAPDPTSPGRHVLAFRPARPGRQYVVAAAAAVPEPRVEPVPLFAESLRDPSNRVEWLAITPEAFRAPAEDLTALRRAGGLDARVVAAEQVWEEFGDGRADPESLARFLRFAADSWSRAPRWVVLAGSGTYDVRDLLGVGDGHLPPPLVATENGLFASDRALLDGVSGMVIGRLPATNAAELADIVAKIAAVEAEPAAAEWRSRALVVADNLDPGGDFAADAAGAARRLPPGSTTGVDLGALGLAAARTELTAALADGVGGVGFFGHGGVDRLTAEGLLTTADVADLDNAPRLPVLAAFTCVANRFELPGFPALGARLVTDPDGGAAAVWAPSAVGYQSQSTILAGHFADALARASGPVRLGDVIDEALAGFRAAGGAEETERTFVLLGDPALEIAGFGE